MKRKGSNALWEAFFHLGIIVLLMALLIVGSTVYYYRALQRQLFSERQNHLTEMTIKISEVIDITVETMRDKSIYASSYIESTDVRNSDEVLAVMEKLAGMMDLEQEILFATDSKGYYYSSMGKTGMWSNIGDYAMYDEVPVIRDVSIGGDKTTCMVFFEKLDFTKTLDTGNEISHVAIAIPIDTMKEYLSVSMFGDNCYTYLVNQDGRVLYRQTFSNKFIENYNVLSELREEKFIMGGEIDDLTRAVSDREQFCLEFRDSMSDENYFVSTVPVVDTDWTILMFVPTRILGVQTSNFMSSFIRYIILISLAVITIVGCLISVIFTNKNNRERMLQQENNNRLLAAAAQEAQSANMAKSEFLSHMSHDIRTPINGIIGMTNIAIKNTDDTGRVKECLGKISGAADHLLALINDVLDMSRIESGKTTVTNEPVDMNEFINNCAAIIDGQLISRQIDFIKEFEAFKYPYVYADQLHLRQVLINILGNAVKFTPDGGKIIFRVKQVGGGENDKNVRYCFEVEDTGIGMSEEFQGRIFEEFSQENGDGRTNYKGTGLGMAISKQLVELMGGSIKLKSSLGKGSCFTVEMEFNINDTPQEKETIHKKVQLNGMKILLVEDNDLNMEIAQEILNDEGIQVTPAMNGKDAVDTFVSSPEGTFDVILMDVMMPVMNGMEATRKIRSSSHPQAKTIPIIAMTANAYKEDEDKVIEAGMNAHVAKPVNAGVLMSVLGQYAVTE